MSNNKRGFIYREWVGKLKREKGRELNKEF